MTTIQIKVPNWLDRIFTWPMMMYRLYKYGYSYRKIYLDEGEFTIVDPKDYYRLGNFKWCINGNGSNLYVVRHVKTGPKKTKIVSLHRKIMNAPPGLFVDHRNLNSLDNRRANLRLATNSQNQFNRGKIKSKTSSKFIGVSFNKHRKKWLSYINFGKKRISLGAFDNEIDAAHTYDRAAREYHKEFARLNFPSET